MSKNVKNVKYANMSQNWKITLTVPEAHPIEDFWADLKRQVYKDNWQAKDLNELQSRIDGELKKYPLENLRARMSETASRLNKIAREDID